MEKFGFIKTLCAASTIVFISCAGSSNTTKQSSSGTPPSHIIGEVGDQKITYNELVSNFGSGVASSNYTLNELQDFLPIYLDYKAKILSAKDEGYFEDERILSEYEVYSKQAAYAFWLENVIRPTLFDEFKSKYTKEMKSSHILIALDQNASPEDTLSVYNKIMEARTKFLNGATIAELDPEYSSKNQGRSMGGDLPWFSVGATVKPFEDVLYSLEVGEISMPFRTQFGYHIVLLEGRRERESSREISHIFIRRGENISILDSAFAELKNGRDWPDVVREYTQDVQSASTGGKIGWVNYGSRYDGAFIDSVMNVDASLSYSEPFSSVYGAHIIKLDSIETFSSPEAYDDFIMKQLEDSRTFTKSNSFVVNWLKENYGGKQNDAVVKELADYFKSLDSTKISDVELSSELSSKTFYSFNGEVNRVQDFLDYLISTNKGPLTSNYIPSWNSSFQEYVVDSSLLTLTIQEFPDFIYQTENYKSGLVVYQINEDKVWSAVTVDTTQLIALYNSNPEDYSYDTRYYYHMVSSSRDTSIQKAIDFVNAGNSPDSIRSNGIAVGVVSDSTGSFQGEPFDTLQNMEPFTFSEVFNYNSRKAVFYLNEVLPARRMTFQEAFNKLLADYQPIREEKWISTIRLKYDVKSYPANLEKAYQAENNSR